MDALRHLDETNATAEVMIVHDQPSSAVSLSKGKNIPETLPSRQIVQSAIDIVRPYIVFNGHMHTRATQDVRFTGEWEKMYRLETLDLLDHDEDSTPIWKNMVFFDTEDMMVTV